MFASRSQHPGEYATAMFLTEAVGARNVLTPEDFEHDPAMRARVHAAFAREAGRPQNGTSQTPIEETLAVLGGGPVHRITGALEAVSVVPSHRVTPGLKSAAAAAAARLYAAESMAFRAAGVVLEWLARGPATLDTSVALRAFPVEYAIARRFCYEDLTDGADDLLDELRQANPYLRVVLRDQRPSVSVDRRTVAELLLARCMDGELPFQRIDVDAFPVLIGRVSSKDPHANQPDWYLGHEQMAAESAKVVAARLLVLLQRQREVLDAIFLNRLVDFILELYALDSAVVRAVQLLNRRGIEKAKLQYDLATMYVGTSITRLRVTAKRLLETLTSASATSDILSSLTVPAAADMESTVERVVRHLVSSEASRG